MNATLVWLDIAGGLLICERCRAQMPKVPELRAGTAGATVVITRAADVIMRRVAFLWRPWLPLGKVTLLAGAPGQGKSQLTAFFAAGTTRNSFEPSDLRKAGTAVLLTAEDDLADTVVPRLVAAGADLARVEFINMRRSMPGGITADGLIKLPGDVATLHDRLKTGGVRLVVFDPVASFVGREHSTYINQDVRDVLDPIIALAAEYGVAVVLVLHLNKSEAKSWALKIAESHAFQAVARTILALAPDPDDEDGEYGTDKMMAATKVNLASSIVPALRFRVEPATVYTADMTPVETSQIELVGTASLYADDLLMDATDKSARREALTWLLEALAGGPMEAKELQQTAKREGYAWRTIQRCYREVCKPARPSGQRGAWVYELQSRHLPTHTPGADGAFKDDDVLSAPNTPGVGVESGGHKAPDNGRGAFGGDKAAADLEAYRRERDRRLGESWDDDG